MNVGWLETSFAVADVGRTTAWYEKLGFQIVGTADAGKNHTLEAGDCRVSLYEGVREPSGDAAGAGMMLTNGRPVFFININKYSAADFVSETGEMLA